MKKTMKYILLGLFIFLFCSFNVSAVEINTICDIGATDGLLYSNQWTFNVSISKINKNETYNWRFENSKSYICSESGCEGDQWSHTATGMGLDSLFSNSAFYNMFADSTNGVSGVYTNKDLKSLLEKKQCPKYIYIASSASKKKIAFIFSSKKIDNAKDLFEKAGYVVEFEQNGGNYLSEQYKKLYEEQVAKMKANIEEYKNQNYGEVYNEECSKTSKFGETGNIVIEYYEKYKKQLFSVNSSYNFSSGDKILEEYKTYKCASKPSDGSNYNGGTEVNGCEVVPPVVKKWIKVALNFVKYVALVLVIILGTLDFIKAAGSGEPDAMKKAGQSFIKRVVAVIILFLLPMIVDLLLNLIELYGANTDCFEVLE